MARLRTLKPSFFTNEELAQLEPLGRLLFAGLWCLADREGRLEDRPARIKVEVLPYDTCDCDALLWALDKSGFIERYEVDERPFIQIVNFTKHQQPHIREAASTIPAPGEHRAGTVPAAGEHGESTGGALRSSVFGLLSSDSGLGEHAPPPKRKPGERIKITEEQTAALVREFSPFFGSADAVKDIIAAALNHVAVDKTKDEYLYVRNWLRRDQQRLPPGGSYARGSSPAQRSGASGPNGARYVGRYTSTPARTLAVSPPDSGPPAGAGDAGVPDHGAPHNGRAGDLATSLAQVAGFGPRDRGGGSA